MVNAAYAQVSRENSAALWQVVLGAWNEQHCYPIAKDFAEVPSQPWYMGDIPHGWACAEFQFLLRDILFFEADEDGDAQLYLAPGVMPHWLADGESVIVQDAPTIFGQLFGYRLTHHASDHRVEITITQPPPPHVRLVYPCHFGSGIQSANANGSPVPFIGTDVQLPRGITQAFRAFAVANAAASSTSQMRAKLRDLGWHCHPPWRYKGGAGRWCWEIS